VALRSLACLLRARAAGQTIRQAARCGCRVDPLQEPCRADGLWWRRAAGFGPRQYQICVATLQREVRTRSRDQALYRILRHRGRQVGAGRAATLPGSANPTAAEPAEPAAWGAPLVGGQRDSARLTEALTIAGRAPEGSVIGEAGAGKSAWLLAR
jgi:hypothetical protein